MINFEDLFMSDFVDSEWLSKEIEESSLKAELQVESLIKTHKDKDLFIRQTPVFNSEGVPKIVLVANYPGSGPLTEVAIFNGMSYEGKYSFTILPHMILSEMREVLTVEQDFGKLWIALPFI